MDCLYIDDRKIRREDILTVQRVTADKVKVVVTNDDIIEITCDGYRSAEHLVYNLIWFLEHPDWPTLKLWQDPLGFSTTKKFRGRLQTKVACEQSHWYIKP